VVKDNASAFGARLSLKMKKYKPEEGVITPTQAKVIHKIGISSTNKIPWWLSGASKSKEF
jgi:hypothetical protein